MRASILGVCFLPKKVPKGPILCFKTPYVSYMRYLHSQLLLFCFQRVFHYFRPDFLRDFLVLCLQIPLKMASYFQEEIRQICRKVPDSSVNSWANLSNYSA